LHVAGPDGAEALPWDALIIASGATDRVLPIAGWTRPGVFTLGAAQVLLKDQGCFIGRRIVFCGSSPLLYLAACQYQALGANIAAVLDTTPFAEKLRAAPQLISDLRTLGRGLGYMARLRAAGVRIEHGVRLVEIAGDAHGVTAISLRDRGDLSLTLPCDAVAFGFGLRPETQLAELAGCTFRYDPVFRQWFADTDRDGRGGNGVYLAGDGQTIGGADAARASGALAALAALSDLDVPVSDGRRHALRARLTRHRRFQRGLARAFGWPSGWPGETGDAVPVCRCENVTAGVLKEALGAPFGPREINRLKALTRCGMGRCQGRFCESAAAELAASALGEPLEAIGRLRVQAPVKPLPMWAADGPGDGP
jgi:NADPH-dependent 2,4-dienoyl-CoA reductase/sulfur reductase-like enzyme